VPNLLGVIQPLDQANEISAKTNFLNGNGTGRGFGQTSNGEEFIRSDLKFYLEKAR